MRAKRFGATTSQYIACAMTIIAAGAPAMAMAQVAPALPVTTPTTTSATTLTIPALTPVEVEIMADLGSKISKTGQTFPLRLAQPIMIDGRIAVGRGTPGEGEVLDAKHGGMGGAQGILLVIARDLKFDGRSLRLRSMRIGQVGADHTKEVILVTGLSPAVGMLLLFAKGGETNVLAGTHALAKTAEAFVVDAAPAPAPVTSESAAPKPEPISATASPTGRILQ